jgi:hypothetical protein
MPTSLAVLRLRRRKTQLRAAQTIKAQRPRKTLNQKLQAAWLRLRAMRPRKKVSR